MPELPEVETIARQLRPQLQSRLFRTVEVFWARTVDRPDVPSFRDTLTGARVLDVARRGKFVTLALDTGQTLLVHLRMTGQLLLLPREANPSDDAYARVCFGLDHGPWLLFSDMRKFGRMYLVNDPSEVLGGLGPEPLMADFSPERLANLLAGRKGRIKPLLLDQCFIAGLGNIYTDEALWRAGVHPLQKAETLTPDQILRLHAGIVSILQEAIEGCGTSLRDYQYRQPDGAMGEFQVLLAVYGRAGEDCPRCGAPIERLKLGQRGTHFCPRCQVLPG